MARKLSPKIVAAELARRAGTKAVVEAASLIDFTRGAFPEQVAFIQDPARRKIAHCPRGAAKSYTLGLGIYDVMQRFPGCTVLYVTKTHNMARNIMWRNVLKAVDKDFGVGMVFNEVLREGRHPNGSVVMLTGIDDDSKQQDKLLGGKYKLVVLDEVAFFDRDLTPIVYRTLGPAVDRVDGSIWMASTSSDLVRGLFYEATRPEHELRAPGWAVHEWDWRANPYVREQLETAHAKLVADNPRIIHTNHYKQHWLNQWTVDETRLVYKFNALLNIYAEPPKLHHRGWTYVLGVDLGWEDDNAFVLTAYHEHDPHLYVLRIHHEPRLTFDQVERIINTQFLADPICAPHKIFIDGANKQGVESMRQRSKIPFQYADKIAKVDFIEQLNGDLVQGRVLMLEEHADLIREMKTLVWLAEGDKIKYPKKEHPGMPNHLCDALLYAWRCGFHYHGQRPEQEPPYGSKEWFLKQSDQIWEREREHLEKAAQQGEWPSEGGWGQLS